MTEESEPKEEITFNEEEGSDSEGTVFTETEWKELNEAIGEWTAPEDLRTSTYGQGGIDIDDGAISDPNDYQISTGVTYNPGQINLEMSEEARKRAMGNTLAEQIKTEKRSDESFGEYLERMYKEGNPESLSNLFDDEHPIDDNRVQEKKSESENVEDLRPCTFCKQEIRGGVPGEGEDYFCTITELNEYYNSN